LANIEKENGPARADPFLLLEKAGEYSA